MDGCNKYGGPRPSSDCDDKPMGGPKEDEANYVSKGYRGGYRGNYYGQNSSNLRDRQSYHRDENRNLNPSEENPPIPRLPEKKPDESEFEKTMREFVIAQKTANDFVNNQFYNLKTKVEQGQRNHQDAIQDLESKFGRISDHQSSRPTASEEVNAEEYADKSQSGTNVQPISQPKAPTAKRPRKEKTPSSTQPMVLRSSRSISTFSPPTTHLQHAEEFVVTDDETKSLDASESADEQGNQPNTAPYPLECLNQIVEEKEIAGEYSLDIPSDGTLLDDSNKQTKDDEPTPESPFDTASEIKFIKSFQAYTISDSHNKHSEDDPTFATNISLMGSGPTMTLDNVVSSSELSSIPNDDLHSMSAFDTVKSGDDADVDMADSEHISKEGTTDTFLNASAEFHSLSGHMDHVCEEVSNLHSRIADMESSIL
ncbi:hypothetical protein Tco_1019056 [Tanacetum coccineum]|uniref:Uncharacterized protein n=1 Tax=Tanacetum coccineum TaxID=301880 RepID=A0ABQ5FW14_9ASTR